MARIIVARHAISAYPEDCLSPEGQMQAVQSKERFAGFRSVVTSSKNRAIQTAQALGYAGFIIDNRANEYESPDINTRTADEYVRKVHAEKWGELASYGRRLLEVIRQYGDDDTLIITHNAVMSAVLRTLTGEVTSFSNLEGFEAKVNRIALWKIVNVTGRR